MDALCRSRCAQPVRPVGCGSLALVGPLELVRWVGLVASDIFGRWRLVEDAAFLQLVVKGTSKMMSLRLSSSYSSSDALSRIAPCAAEGLAGLFSHCRWAGARLWRSRANRPLPQLFFGPHYPALHLLRASSWRKAVSPKRLMAFAEITVGRGQGGTRERGRIVDVILSRHIWLLDGRHCRHCQGHPAQSRGAGLSAALLDGADRGSGEQAATLIPPTVIDLILIGVVRQHLDRRPHSRRKRRAGGHQRARPALPM